MRKITQGLRVEFETRLRHERIAAATGPSRGAVSNCVRRAVQRNLGWPLPAGMDQVTLERLLSPQAVKLVQYTRADYAYVHQELKPKGVTLQLLREEYRATQGEGAYQYSQFCWPRCAGTRAPATALPAASPAPDSCRWTSSAPVIHPASPPPSASSPPPAVPERVPRRDAIRYRRDPRHERGSRGCAGRARGRSPPSRSPPPAALRRPPLRFPAQLEAPGFPTTGDKEVHPPALAGMRNLMSVPCVLLGRQWHSGQTPRDRQ